MPVTKEHADAVAQARERVLDGMPNDCREVIEIAERDVDALIAAVRAEGAADTKRLDWLDARMVRRPDSWGYNDATNVWSVVANGPRDAGGNLRPEIADVRAAIDAAITKAQP